MARNIISIPQPRTVDSPVCLVLPRSRYFRALDCAGVASAIITAVTIIGAIVALTYQGV